MAKDNIKIKNKKIENKAVKKITCGIVMPISEIDGCSESHWENIERIIKESIEEIEEFEVECKLVSRSDETRLIHETIIQNIYSNDIVVCDVSCKNANVMFELGMRLAFNKPVVIIKDKLTNYCFDTGNIEHLEYPRDLRYNEIMEFKEILKLKVLATYKKEWKYLENFGEFKLAQVEEKEVSVDKYILNKLNAMDEKINLINLQHKTSSQVATTLRSNKSLTIGEVARSGIKLHIDMSLVDDSDKGKTIRVIRSVLTDLIGKEVVFETTRLANMEEMKLLNVTKREFHKINREFYGEMRNLGLEVLATAY